MNEISSIRTGSMPAHLQASTRRLNAAAHANLVGGGFPVLSYKGKTWSVKHHGDWEVIKGSQGIDHKGKPLPEQPVQYLDVIVVGMAVNLSKTYYERSYGTGDDNAPDCFSVDSVAPDAGAPHKQHSSCKVCPKNQWGSRVTDAGKRAKACQDNRRIAVVPADDPTNEVYGGAMLLRIPPMSLLNLDRYATMLEQKGADITQVVTRIGFVPEMQYPALKFDPVGWIEDPAIFVQANEIGESEQVRRMLNDASVQGGANGGEAHTQAPARFGPRPAHLQAPAPAPRPAPAPAPQAWAQAVQTEAAIQQSQAAQEAAAQTPQALQAQVAQVARGAVEAAAKAKAAPAPTQAVVQGAPDDLEEAVDDLLSGN